MKELKESGTTILFVSHATEQIKRFCTRAVWLKNGQVKEDGEASQIVDLYEKRMNLCKSVAEYKIQNNKKVLDKAREEGYEFKEYTRDTLKDNFSR